MSSSPSPSIGLYERLAEGVRIWIDARGWTDFSEIQANAMPQLLDGHGALIVAPTASGKTEAAVLPLLSRVIEDGDEPIALLYVAPLRALINDQARRVAKIVAKGAEYRIGDAVHAHGEKESGARERARLEVEGAAGRLLPATAAAALLKDFLGAGVND